MPIKKIKVALIGVGNVASALTQSLHAKKISGIWHKYVAGYSFADIEIVAAFDIDKGKIGKDLSEAIFKEPNVSPEFARVPRSNVRVKPGVAKDDVPRHLGESVTTVASIANDLRESGAALALNLLPSGMQRTSTAYANECLSAGLSFINATPSIIAMNPTLRKKFQAAKQVLIGDDLMSQFGGTAFHKGILEFINSRGIKVGKSYQLDVGGGNETLNTISEDVKIAKRDIKTEAIAAEIPYKFATVAGTTDYVDYMGNNRTSYFWISCKGIFDSDIKIDVYLRTNDGANSANILLDVIRATAYSLRRKEYGSPDEICNYGFKRLPKPVLLHQAQVEFYKKYVK
ncbi:MAG: inositol-3-phosphate synthase [Nitrososphaerales archaeon]